MTAARFVVVEGTAGAGTTTQARLLVGRLEAAGRRVHLTREPSVGRVGRMIRESLAGGDGFNERTMALLFAADRFDHLAREVEPALAAGRWVVCDRYELSSYVYQGGALGQRGWADVGAYNAGARAPDLTALIEVPAEVAAERRRARGAAEDRYEAAEVQRRVCADYREAARLLERVGQRVAYVDGTGSVEEVAAAIWRAVEAIP